MTEQKHPRFGRITRKAQSHAFRQIALKPKDRHITAVLVPKALLDACPLIFSARRELPDRRTVWKSAKRSAIVERTNERSVMFELFFSKPRKRTVAFPVCESLESRCLLSAAMKGGTELAAEVHVAHHEKKAPVVLPHLDGSFLMITNTDHGGFTGTLTLTQQGKRLTGTLFNPGQPPGNFTATIVKLKANTHTLAAASTQFMLKGKVVDGYVNSKAVKFRTGPINPFDFPEDAHDNTTEITAHWDDDDIPNPPDGLPDFQLQRFPG
jgi:hypothetical protein